MKSKQLKKICAFETCIFAHNEEEGICMQVVKADPCDKVLSKFLEVKRYGSNI